jgi:hypothetical protein
MSALAFESRLMREDISAVGSIPKRAVGVRDVSKQESYQAYQDILIRW